MRASFRHTTRETRRILLLQATVNNAALTPGAAASNAIRAAAERLHLDPANGVRVRLTGPVVLADEELATLTENIFPLAALTVTAMLLILWLAVRSIRIIVAIAISTFTGFLFAVALGLLLAGKLNLISVAFIPVFVGLGIDFAIQFSVRFRNERALHEHATDALAATGTAVGGSLTLAAASIAAGFFAFIPTSYVGASELGLIAGVGIVIAFLLSITLLPALLVLLRPRIKPSAIGLPALARIGHDRIVLLGGGVMAVVALATLPFLQFDFNPLHMRSPRTESVSTLVDLMSDPDRTPNTLDVLAPTLADADALAARLSQLPEVARTMTLSSFVPDEQPRKLAMIDDAATLLDLTLYPDEIKRAPTDGEIAQSVKQTAKSLSEAAANSNAAARADALRLAAALERLARPDAAAPRARASAALIGPLTTTLDQIRLALRADPISAATLPDEIKRDYIAQDGRARIQVFPKGDLNDNRTLRQFSDAVRTLAPYATGVPITTQEAASTIVGAFIEAGLLALLAITVLLAIALRRIRYVVLTSGADPPGRAHDACLLRPDASAPQLRQHHRAAASVRHRRRVQYLLRRRMGCGREKPPWLEPFARNRVQRAYHARRLRQPLPFEPSRHREHGQTPDHFGRMDARGHADIPAGAARACGRHGPAPRASALRLSVAIRVAMPPCCRMDENSERRVASSLTVPSR